MTQLAIDLRIARARRDAGMQMAADHQDAIDARWKDAAYTFLLNYARTHERFTSEVVRHAAKAAGIETAIPKAWGPLFQRAARDQVIRKDGYAIAKQRHLSPCPLWQSLTYWGAA